MINRRLFLFGAAALTTPITARASLPVPPTKSLTFNIVMDKSVVGLHMVNFEANDDDLTVTISVEVLVKLGPIPVFRYRHHNVEKWRGTTYLGNDAMTSDNGTDLRMSSRLDGTDLIVEGTHAKRYVAPPGTIGATHWNKHQLDGAMLNTQDGVLLRPKVTPGPRSMVNTASGTPIPATLFSLTGDLKLDLWYDDSDQWTALRFLAPGGAVVDYQKV